MIHISPLINPLNPRSFHSPCSLPGALPSRRFARPTGRSRRRRAAANAGAVTAAASLVLFGFLGAASAQQPGPSDGAPPDPTTAPAEQAPSAAEAPSDSEARSATQAPNATQAPSASRSTSGTDLDKARSELARARAQLEQAAREVARLSAEVSAPVVNEIRRRWSNAPWQRAQLGLVIENEDRGALVSGVTPGGPGDEAGIEVGDIILSVDGMSLAGRDEPPARELISHLAGIDADDEVRLRVERGGAPRDVVVVAREAEPFFFAFGRPFDRWESYEPGESPRSFDSHGPNEPGQSRDGRAPRDRDARAPRERFAFPPTFVRSVIQPFFGRWRDMELVSLTPDLGAYFGVSEGLLVVRAPNDASLPLHDGDVILSIGDRKPTSPEHAMRILASFEPGETLRLTIMRQRQQQMLEIDLPKEGDTAPSD